MMSSTTDHGNRTSSQKRTEFRGVNEHGSGPHFASANHVDDEDDMLHILRIELRRILGEQGSRR